MKSGQAIGILGGSFDPIHNGHLIMAEHAMDQLSLDVVIFAPAGSPPHKPGEMEASADDRLEMVRAAVSSRTGFVCSTIDLSPDEPSYTWKLLERAQNEFHGATLTFILGGDSLKDFGGWARPERILELARIAVVARPGAQLTSGDTSAVAGLSERIDWVETPMCDVSSTDLRTRIAAGQSIRFLVPDPVRDYIASRSLYR
jgi:nicotinate-nucleotide adenylyltransferase